MGKRAGPGFFTQKNIDCTQSASTTTLDHGKAGRDYITARGLIITC